MLPFAAEYRYDPKMDGAAPEEGAFNGTEELVGADEAVPVGELGLEESLPNEG